MIRVRYLMLGLCLILLACSEDDPDTTAPGNIVDLEGSRSGEDGAVTLRWTAPGDDGTDGTAASYDIRYSPTIMNDFRWDDYTVLDYSDSPQTAGSEESFTTSALELGSWFFAIRSLDEAGNLSGISNNTRVTTLDDDPPLAIEDLDVVRRTTTTVTLTWTSPEDVGPTRSVAEYDIRFLEGLLDEESWDTASRFKPVTAPLEPGMADTVTVVDLSPGRLYSIGVRSLDHFGNISPLSNVVEVATSVPSLRQITASSRSVGAIRPVWSPDGKRIAFTADWDERFQYQVYTTDPKGSYFVKHTNQEIGIIRVRWSPDGESLAYIGGEEVGGSVVYSVWVVNSMAGSVPMAVASHPPAWFSGLAWSPSGDEIVYVTRHSNPPVVSSTVRLVNADGSDPRTLFSVAGDVTGIDWCPDGGPLALAIRPEGEEPDVWLYSLDGGTSKKLTIDPGADIFPRFSPDGSRILFGSSRGGNFDIWIMDVNGGTPTQVTVDERDQAAGTWSPDGTSIAYDSFDPVSQILDIFVQVLE